MRTNARKFRLALTSLTLAALMLSLFGAVPAWAAFDDTYVDDDAGYSDTDGDADFATIQAAIDNTNPGGTVHVAAGTYNERIAMKDGVTVQGAGPGESIIDGTDLAPPVGTPSQYGVVNFLDIEGNTAIKGFSIRHRGTTSSPWSNYGIDMRGPLHAVSGLITVENNHISAVRGKGINIGGGYQNVLIKNNVIAYDAHPQVETPNPTPQEGIYCAWGSTTDIINNVVYGWSTGIRAHQWNPSPTVNVKNTIVSHCTNGLLVFSFIEIQPHLSYSHFWDIDGDYPDCWFGGGAFSCVNVDPCVDFGDGNLFDPEGDPPGPELDPLFINPTDDPLTWNFYLQDGSPCSGTGENGIDMGLLPPNNPPNAPTSPQCEGETNPTGVKDPTPEFGWTFSDPDGGDTQSAYQIIVGTTEGGSDMWDSGKVTSSSSTDISYAGSALAWGAAYHWKVKTWDNHGAEGAYCADQTFTMETAASEVWVDDNWAGTPSGTEVEPGKTFGYNAFATIQDGIDNVAGGTVNVAEGTYAENVTINKSLTLKAGSNPVIDPGGGTAVTINASNVIITGFTIQNAATGILVTSGTGNVIHFCDIVNNTTWSLNNTSGNLVDAENNWWGDASGPHYATLNPSGTGNAVSDNADYEPWTGAETKTETVSGSGTVTGTSTGGDITIDATGDHTISTSQYVSNPGGDHTFKSTGYYDVHLDNKTGVNSLTIEFCPATEDTVIYYWDRTDWLACSDQHYDAGTGCVVVTINGTTDPNLDYLTGGPFASGYTPPPPKPVGGIIVPVSKVELLAPWLGLAALMALAIAAVVVRRRKA